MFIVKGSNNTFSIIYDKNVASNYENMEISELPEGTGILKADFTTGEVWYENSFDKQSKLEELETFMQNLKNTGVEYEEKWYKCDDEAQNNVLSQIALNSITNPTTVNWYTRNGESGVTTFTSEEFSAFALVLANKISEIKNKYYAYKYQIEQAEDETTLNAIVFE